MSTQVYEGKSVQWVKSTLQQLKDKKANLGYDLQSEISSHHSEVVQFVSLVNQCVGDLAGIKSSLNVDFGLLKLDPSQRLTLGEVSASNGNPSSDDQHQSQLMASKRKENKECFSPEVEWLVQEMVDELDVLIAHREFKDAVDCLKRGETVYQNVGSKFIEDFYGEDMVRDVQLVLKSRKDFIGKLLLKQMNIDALVRLGPGYAHRAQVLYLQNQQESMHTKLRMISFENDVEAYVHDQCFVFFTLLSRVVGESMRLFVSQQSTLTIFGWIQDEIQWFLNKFRSLVFNQKQRQQSDGEFHDFRMVLNCLTYIDEGVQIMKDGGFDIGAIFLRQTDVYGLKQDVQQLLEVYSGAKQAQLSAKLAEDDFNQLVGVSEMNVEIIDTSEQGGISQHEKSKLVGAAVVSSAQSCMRTLVEAIFIDLCPFISDEQSGIIFGGMYFKEVIDQLQQMIHHYSRQLMDSLKDRFVTFKQRLNILISMQYLYRHLFPLLHKVLSKQCSVLSTEVNRVLGVKASPLSHYESYISLGFNREIDKFVKTQDKLLAMCEIATDLTCSLYERELVKSTWCFGVGCLGGLGDSVNPSAICMSYAGDAYPVIEQLIPNDQMIRLVKTLQAADDEIESVIGQFNVAKSAFDLVCFIDKKFLMTAILTILVNDLSDDRNWVKENGQSRDIGYTGLHQLLLDIHFFTKLCDNYLTEGMIKQCTDVCSRAVKIYLKNCSDAERKRVLKASDWYDKRFAEVVGKEKLRKVGSVPAKSANVDGKAAKDRK
ncbi:hypothetical protein MP228_011651 [Amoeboaphelidium protococcarum]|nr:hypothetical protein MP228_011651 [Amoeboaphelidium protococcarum]